MGMPNLGIALGAGTNQYLKMQQADKEDEFKQQQLDLQKEANQRQNEMLGMQKQEFQRANTEREAANKVWQDAMPIFKGGWQTAAQHLGEAYKANDPRYGYDDGKDVDFQIHKNGVYVTPKNTDGSYGQTQFYTPQQVMQEHMRGVHAQLAAISPQYGQGFMNWLDTQNKESTRQGERAEDRADLKTRWAAEDKFRTQQLANSGASLGLARERFDLEKPGLEADRDAKKELYSLKKTLAATTDPAERTKIQQKIYDLVGGDSHGDLKVVKNEDGSEYLIMRDRKTGQAYTVDPKALPVLGRDNSSPGGGNNLPVVKTQAELASLKSGTHFLDANGVERVKK